MSSLDEMDRTAEGLPRLDFATFVLSLSHSALVHLGEAPDPDTGRSEMNLPLARQTIDLISMLEEKTRGNLTGDEERLVGQILFDLRMRFVELSKSK
ncbi:MAG: DUF1844 domain-containing protein [Myxococcota bacterium]|nr:DUF1844 domain-containing protein [Myxococcota bacterium]